MVQLCARTVPLSSPAGITTALLGGDEGPSPRISLLPQIRAGGDAGLAAAYLGGPTGDAGAAAEERSNGSASQASPALPAAKATSVQPVGHLRS